MNTIKLSDLTGPTVCLADKYTVKLPERRDYLIVAAGCVQPKAGCRFDHPNVAAKKQTIFETKSYWPSGRKKWFAHAGVDFYFVLPGAEVNFVQGECGYSYIPVVLAGKKCSFNTSGGGSADGWTDFLGPVAHTNISYSQRRLKQLAEIAMPPAEYVGWGIRFDLHDNSPERADDYMAIMARHTVKLAAGMKIMLDDRFSFNGSNGPFEVESVLAKRKRLLAFGAAPGGRFRVQFSQIDWLKTAQENGVQVARPVVENKIGCVLAAKI